ncbi:MAG: hypothetical protein LBI69_04345, partial [Puniceicoccales bacterium]|nr:hypothetical protein [Puniceicoccales bacterium]
MSTAMAVVEHTGKNFRGFLKNFFPAHTKAALIVAGATISITTIAAGIIFQMPALIYGLCATASIFCVVIAVYYWKFRKDKNADSPSNFKTSIPLKAPHPEEETSSHNPLAKEVESIQLQDAELIQPCEEQISIAPIKDLIKPSK